MTEQKRGLNHMTRRLIAILLSLILVFSAAPGVAETAHDLVDLGAEALQNEEYIRSLHLVFFL